MIYEISILSKKQTEMIDITKEISGILAESKVQDGICILFVPHTTAGITINENADPDVVDDIIMELNKIVPIQDNYKHLEGNSAAHLKSSIVGFSETLIIKNGGLLLGTWQGIYFCEYDGPRNRKLVIKIIKG